MWQTAPDELAYEKMCRHSGLKRAKERREDFKREGINDNEIQRKHPRKGSAQSLPFSPI